jgi:hypothetical protein
MMVEEAVRAKERVMPRATPPPEFEDYFEDVRLDG